MRVTVNGLTFDTADGECQIILSSSQGNTFAFIQVVDDDGYIKRYWGEYDHDDPESSITAIIKRGGKWPELPAN